MDRWVPEALILAQDSLPMGTPDNHNHSLAGREDPLKGPCTGKLPKTQCTWWRTGEETTQETRA